MAEIKYRAIYERALKLKGIDNQIDITLEECAELIQALVKFKRTKEKYDMEVIKEHISEEVADNLIMLEQLQISFGKEFGKQVDDYKEKKIARLIKRLELIENDKDDK